MSMSKSKLTGNPKSISEGILSLEEQIKNAVEKIEGQILTIVDAGYGEMEKTKFAKDLIKQTFTRGIFNLRLLVEEFDGNETHEVEQLV